MLFASDLKTNRQKKTSVGQKFWGLHNVSHFGPGGLANGPQMVLISRFGPHEKSNALWKPASRGRFRGGPERARTADLCVANAALSQLSYRPGMPLSPSGRQSLPGTPCIITPSVDCVQMPGEKRWRQATVARVGVDRPTSPSLQARRR